MMYFNLSTENKELIIIIIIIIIIIKHGLLNYTGGKLENHAK